MKKTAEAFQEYLVQKGFIKSAQVDEVRLKAAEAKQNFKSTCFKLGYIEEEMYAAAEAEFLEMPFVKLSEIQIDAETLKLLSVQLVKQHGVLPISKEGKDLNVVVFDPYNIFMIDAVRDLTRLNPKLSLATETDLWRHVQKFYQTASMSEAAQSFQATMLKRPGDAAKTEGTQQFQLDFRKLVTGGGKEAPIVKMVDQMIMQAVDDRASDIHIEPEQEFVRVRYRIDGVLVESQKLPKDVQSPIISRVKIMAKLDIAEHRRPQDGKIQMKVNQNDIDIRVSAYPTTYGENIVLRILDRSNSILDMKELGLSQHLLDDFTKLLHQPYGIILVTGPTGAGKTTTLYAALQAINTVDKNIMTIEDPIEYQIPMIRQSQVNPKAGVTFSTGLRSLLRQDPDVMLIGEIRDRETAEIAIESALTGHLVFATLHTNDAAGAITRLDDMGIEHFLVSSSLLGVMAQRLVRKLCPHCRKAVPPKDLKLSAEELKELEMIWQKRKDAAKDPAVKSTPFQIYEAVGCEACSSIGHKGRFAIYELFRMDDKVRELIVHKASQAEIRKYVFNEDNPPMRLYGLQKVLDGETTLEEVYKVVQED